MGFSEVETGLKKTNCSQLAHPWQRPPSRLALQEARNVGVTDSVGLAGVPSGKAGSSATSSSRLAGAGQSQADRKGGRRGCLHKAYPQLPSSSANGQSEAKAAQPLRTNTGNIPLAPRELPGSEWSLAVQLLWVPPCILHPRLALNSPCSQG